MVGYFACAQYDVLFLYVILNDSEESHRVSEEYMFYGKPPSREIAAPAARKDSISGLSIVRWDISLALNMTYFFLLVFASMPSEQTCLQGFANDGIHETIGVFLNNAKNRQVSVRR